MPQSPTNLLLSMLPLEQRVTFLRLFEPVALPVRTTLYEPDRQPSYVHFMTSGMASVVVTMKDGDVSEVGLVGREGMPESLHLLGSGRVETRCFMQIEGTALRMRYREFEQHFRNNEAIHRAVLAFLQYQQIMLSQIAACNRLHEVEERLARWLLMVSDLVGSQELQLTQEFVSQMLGARRSTVTLVAGTLQRSGLIEYTRGHVHILDRERLTEVACECYTVCCDALRLLGARLAPLG